jgi:PadR family transcriptional regulator, regulatory protein PadR
MIPKLTDYETQLLDGWEEVYKRGQLTLWILLALQHGPKYMGDIKTYIETHSSHTVTADDQSMYRALRRYYETDLVTYSTEQTAKGPDRKIYALTDTGCHVLSAFITRNLSGLLRQPIIQTLTNKE